jgi:hypothetical protein
MGLPVFAGIDQIVDQRYKGFEISILLFPGRYRVFVFETVDVRFFSSFRGGPGGVA